MARTAQTTCNSFARVSVPFKEPPTTTKLGIAPSQALYDSAPPGQPAEDLGRSKRTRRATERIATHRTTQATTHAMSAKIQRTKAHKARQATKKKRVISSPNLSETDWNDDDDDEDGSDGDSMEEEVFGEDQGKDKGEYKPKTIGREDTDLDHQQTSERECLLKCLYEALDKDFSHHATEELCSLWKSHCESEEADEELEVEYPQIETLGTLAVTTTGGSQSGSAGPSQPERRSKRAFDDQLAGSAKRARMSVNPRANPSAIEPPSSQPPPIAPPTFPTPPGPTNEAAHREPNAPSPPARPDGPHPPAPAPLERFPTAATLVDNPEIPAARSPSSAPPHPPTPNPRPSASAPVSQLPASAPAPAPRPPVSVSRPLAPAPRTAMPAPTLSSRAAAPAPRPAPPAPTPLVPASRANRRADHVHPLATAPRALSSTQTRTAGSLRLPPVLEDEQEAPEGPVQGAPSRTRGRPYTNLMDDCAEQIAEAEALRTGKPAAGRKPKPCARHYFGDDCMLIPHTVKRQFGLTVSECAYGNYGWMVYLSKEAWKHMFKVLLPGKELCYPDENYFPMIANRGATNQGKVMKHVRPVGHTMGNFIHPTMVDEDEQHNIREVKRVLPRLFHYKTHRAALMNIRALCALATGLFHSPSAVGPSHLDLFGGKDKKMPLPAVAFILTNLTVSLGKFGDGRRQTTDLNASQQYNIYVDHACGLKTYAHRAPNRMAEMQRKWYNYCVAYAGITDDDNQNQQAEHDIFDDIPPDTSAPSSPQAADAPLPPVDDLAPPAEPAEPSEPLLKPYFPPPTPPGMLLRAGMLLDADGWEQYDNELLYGDQELNDKPEPEDEPKPECEYDDNGRLTAHSKGKGRKPPRSARPSYPRPPSPSRSRR
ncbi:hypothetical protein FRC07_014617 [Ceratobasidium sp. 392]|nr:hypothetical protein FRC07_014617 [Ceratobasidium sp. 392]